MAHCFRMALWMFLLIGSLQAMPTSSTSANPSCVLEETELAFELLQGVKCNNNVNFTSPIIGKQTKCLPQALKHFTDQMENAAKHCIKNVHIKQTLDELTSCNSDHTTAECTFTWETHDNFEKFVGKTQEFVHLWNNNQS